MAFDTIVEADSVREKETLYKRSEFFGRNDSTHDKTSFLRNEDNSKPKLSDASHMSGSYFKASPRKGRSRN